MSKLRRTDETCVQAWNWFLGRWLMAYSTKEQIRLLTGWDSNIISDANLDSIISLADRLIAKAFSTKVYRERITTGNIDGSNTEFKVKHAPIADTNFDSSVDENDVEVYYATWTDDEHNLDFGSAQTVSSVEADNGIVNVATAPTTTTAEAGLYITYSYTSPHVDYNLIVLAANYLAVHLASYRVQGEAADYSQIEASFLRRDIAGAPDEWMRKAIMALNAALGTDKFGIGFRAVGVEDYGSNVYHSR